MTEPRWERLKDILDAARRQPPAERESFLRTACGTDAELLSEALELVRAADESGDFLQPPDLPAPAPTRATPRVLGEFELVREIGRGAMGVVYEARQRSLGRTVALKVLGLGLTTTPRQVERFTREAQAVARLNHPGIVPVFTTGHTSDAHYFAMEYVPGGSLGNELERQRRGTAGLLPAHGSPDHTQACARAVAELADALQFAHDHGIVHRDVKPQNVLIGGGAAMRLVDFGLAKDESQGSLSRTGEVAGTPHYMSPEQARARRQAIDHRTDVYSLGVVLYEMLTLQRPFDGHSAEEVLSQILHKDPLPVRRRNPRVPRDLAVICATAMAKEARDRYPTAAALAADVRRFLHFESIEARRPGLGRRAQSFVRKHALALAGVVLLLGGAGVGRSWTVYAGERDRREVLITELESLDETGEWDAVGEERLRALNKALPSYRPVNGEESALRDRLQRRLDELHASWSSEVAHKLQEGARVESPEGVGGGDEAAVLDGFRLLTRALIVFPDDQELPTLFRSDIFHPRVTLLAQDASGNALSGRVSYRELDQVTGVPGGLVELGQLPIEARSLPPAFYRFVFEIEGQPFRELTRLLLRAQDPKPVVCSIPSDRDPLVGMHRIEGESLHPPRRVGDLLCPFLDRETTVATFWIDETEVSVRQYRAFLAATGRPPPDEWQWLPADGRYEDRPAVGISWYEAQAYAEWAGKRLPSHAEWDLAARGPDGARFADESVGFQGTVFGPNVARVDREQAFGQYLAHTSDVNAPESARGRNGLFHMLGNVQEWTESLGFDRLDDDTRYVPRPADRLVLSSPWYSAARGFTLATMSLHGPERRYTNEETGFRCARSAAP